jgi:hypothetical protein
MVVGSFAEKDSEDNPRWPFGEVYGWGDERELSATRLLVLPKGRLTLRQARSLDELSLGITPWQWGRILARTSEEVRPPEAHVFLRDARHARNIGLYRRSVLDSATAAELGLAKLRDDELAESKACFEGYVQSWGRSMGKSVASTAV